MFNKNKNVYLILFLEVNMIAIREKATSRYIFIFLFLIKLIPKAILIIFRTWHYFRLCHIWPYRYLIKKLKISATIENKGN